MDFEEEYADIETSWIDDFENIDALYNDFYTEQLDSLSIHYLYVNKKSELFHIEKDIIDISNSVLKKKDLKNILIKNMYLDNKYYRPISIIKYNITVAPKDIDYYVKNSEEFEFIEPKNSINDINFEESISLFHDINSVYIVFHEQKKSNTKKVFIKSNKLNKRKTKKNKLKQ
tara:strand:+ start:1318 stop:1836 length:519 start_codon:yes stop_codon:yes gene_type:complete